MKNWSAMFTVALVGLLAASCLPEKLEAPTVPSAVDGVISSKTFLSPVSIEYDFTPADFDLKVHVSNPGGGLGGTACSYPLTFSPAVRKTLEAITDQSFRRVVPAGTTGAYKIKFAFVSFDPQIGYHLVQYFMGGVMTARAELALRVSVFDPSGHVIARETIRGSAKGRTDDVWHCSDGSKALSEALQKALRSTAEQYADRVINNLPIN